MSRTPHDNVERILAFRERYKRSGRIVIIAPHPDDEVLGTGRLILAAKRRALDPAFILLTDGGASHPNSYAWPTRQLGQLRKQELRRALGRLGLKQPAIRYMGWRDGCLADDGKALALRAMLRSLNASLVLVTSPADHHPDHKAAFRLAEAACANGNVPLWTYAVWSRASASTRRSIGRDRAQQYWAIKAHRSQTSNYIKDDPTGFSFPPALLTKILQTAEQFDKVIIANRRFQSAC